MRTLLIAIGLAGCATAAASRREVAVNNAYGCNAVINDQARTGGLPLTFGWIPCADPGTEVAEHRIYAPPMRLPPTPPPLSDELELGPTATAACENVAPEDRERSPFAQGRQISQVVPIHGAGGEPEGVRVVFKPGRGLTAGEMRDHIACQRARWQAVEQDPRLAPHDPTLVDGAHVTVSDRDGHVEVTVRTDTPEQAELAAARAAGALAMRPPQTANR